MTLTLIRSALILAAAALLLALGSQAVLGDQTKDLTGTKHDVGSPGTEPCLLCHIPSDPLGEGFWAMPPNSTGLFAGIRPLCFSCHDGTVTPSAAYVFNPTTPTHKSSPAVRGEDCDRCHDPHEEGFGKFVKWGRGANMCQNCHEGSGPTNHPVDVNALEAGIIPQDSHFDPTEGDFSGTRLWNVTGTGPGGYIKCLTCHAPHGGAPGTSLVTVAFVQSGHESFLPLCINCHFGWSTDQAGGRQ